MKEPDLEENELSALFENNTLIIKKNSLIPNLKQITAVSPSNEKTQIKLEDIGNGEQIAKILEPESGIWKLSDDNSSISIIIGNYNSYEYLDVRANDENVRPIAEHTLGSINWINTKNNFQVPKIKHLEKEKLTGNNNINLMKNKQYYVKSLDQISIMPWYLALILSILLIFISWYRESK